MQSMKTNPAKRNGLKCIKSILCAYPQKRILAARYKYTPTSTFVCMYEHIGLFAYESARLFIKGKDLSKLSKDINKQPMVH